MAMRANKFTCMLHMSRNWNTVESLIFGQSRDPVSTVLCHSVQFKSPNDQGGATVQIESRDCSDMRDSTEHNTFPQYRLKWFWARTFLLCRTDLLCLFVAIEAIRPLRKLNMRFLQRPENRRMVVLTANKTWLYERTRIQLCTEYTKKKKFWLSRQGSLRYMLLASTHDKPANLCNLDNIPSLHRQNIYFSARHRMRVTFRSQIGRRGNMSFSKQTSHEGLLSQPSWDLVSQSRVQIRIQQRIHRGTYSTEHQPQ